MNNIFESKESQLLITNHSKWSLMNKYYEAKRSYYIGDPTLTDLEFDALETSIKAIHDPYLLRQWGCVGYDENQHKGVKILFDFFKKQLRKFEQNWNEINKTTVNEEIVKDFVAEISTKPIEEVIEVEKVINYMANEFGQLGFGI